MCQLKRLYCNICQKDRPIPFSENARESRIVMIVREVICGRDYCNFSSSTFSRIPEPREFIRDKSCGSERCAYEDCMVSFIEEVCDHHFIIKKHRGVFKRDEKPFIHIKERVTRTEMEKQCLFKFY